MTSACIQERQTSGLNDRIVELLLEARPGLLASAVPGTTFVASTNAYTKHTVFNNHVNEAPYHGLIFGQIASESDGTELRARGNHYLGGPDKLNKIKNSSKPKDVFVLEAPTNGPEIQMTVFENQLVTLDEVVEKERANDESRPDKPIIKSWTKRRAGEKESNRLVVTMGPKYGMDTTTNAVAGSKRSKKALPNEKDEGHKTAPEPSPPFKAPQVGDLHDPTVLEDYGGELFDHSPSMKLVQLDVRGTDGQLIPPGEMYGKLRTGTLVLINASLHIFNMPEANRKTFQLNCLSLRVLAESDLPVVPRVRFQRNGNGNGNGATNAVFDSFCAKLGPSRIEPKTLNATPPDATARSSNATPTIEPKPLNATPPNATASSSNATPTAEPKAVNAMPPNATASSSNATPTVQANTLNATPQTAAASNSNPTPPSVPNIKDDKGRKTKKQKRSDDNNVMDFDCKSTFDAGDIHLTQNTLQDNCMHTTSNATSVAVVYISYDYCIA
ncbi:hypothetical protein FPV67DRAFT_1666127 [Lyophyllum atratum]|nr:hypothetical protein FPV67DRAFT_1666127 [Lyophyllum atratum]